jgi:hypothetical protein
MTSTLPGQYVGLVDLRQSAGGVATLVGRVRWGTCYTNEVIVSAKTLIQ